MYSVSEEDIWSQRNKLFTLSEESSKFAWIPIVLVEHRSYSYGRATATSTIFTKSWGRVSIGITSCVGFCSSCLGSSSLPGLSGLSVLPLNSDTQ